MCLSVSLFLTLLGLRCCVWACPGCGERGPRWSPRAASHRGGGSWCGAQAVGVRPQELQLLAQWLWPPGSRAQAQ